jgi:hypothetical protein
LIAGGTTECSIHLRCRKESPASGKYHAPQTTQSASSYGAAVTASDFKYPTVLKSGLAADKKLGDDWIATIEASYSKDINAVYFSNIN